jgi:hypothetical protein
VICTKAGVTCVRIVATFVTTVAMSVTTSKDKFRIGLGEEERRRPDLLPPFFVIAIEAKSAIRYRPGQ